MPGIPSRKPPELRLIPDSKAPGVSDDCPMNTRASRVHDAPRCAEMRIGDRTGPVSEVPDGALERSTKYRSRFGRAWPSRRPSARRPCMPDAGPKRIARCLSLRLEVDTQ